MFRECHPRVVIASLAVLSLLMLALPAGAETGGDRATSSPETIHILPLGDSITQGGRRDRPEWTYRYPLFCMLTEAGLEFDFIGSMDKGLHPQVKWPDCDGEPFDTDHEGHYGWKTAKVRDNLRKWMSQWSSPPHVALIHLGTNDQGAEDFTDAIVEPLREIIGMLREANPEVVVLVGHLNFKGGAAAKIRPLVQKMVEEVTTEKSPVKAVHHYRGFTANPKREEPDTFDWAHPNPKGQRKMAQKWFEAMKPYLSRFGQSLPGEPEGPSQAG